MNPTDTAQRRTWSGFWFAQLLAAVFLAGCLWWVIRDLSIALPNHRITASLSVEGSLGSVLIWQLAAFAGAVLLCHVLLGLLAFGLARLTEAAFAGRHLPGRRWLVSACFMLLAALIMAVNSTRHPGSLFSGEESWLRLPVAFGIRIGEAMALAGLVTVLWFAARALLRIRTWMPAVAVGFVGVSASVVATAVMLQLVTRGSQASTANSVAPNVVLIGIDSLRNDMVDPDSGEQLTPRVNEFLAGAHRFRDTTSPLARTFPAWVSILTGRHPVSTGARFNLIPRAMVHEGETLGDMLHERGYRTVYATDEVRFSNLDESFGFDQLITPPIGAIDFLLGHAGDIPLVNLTASTDIGGWLFPSNHGNRAAYLTYQPEQFVERLEDEIDLQGPSLLAIHLTLAHWPFSWGGDAALSTPQKYRPGYRRTVQAVDRQFEQVMRVLEDKGVLDNSIVVLLSDHGEALGHKNDSMLRATGTDPEIFRSLFGHGTSVVSPNQYQVLLAMRAFGPVRIPGAPGNYDWPVSLEDVRPTLEELVAGAAPQGVDGMSLLSALRDPAAIALFDARIRFTETGFNTESTLAGHYEASGLIDEAAVFYELDTTTGRAQFRRDRLPTLISRKQRAAISRDHLLAALPEWGDKTSTYLYTTRRDPYTRRLEGRPDPASEPEATRLWDALEARFPGELLPVTPHP